MNRNPDVSCSPLRARWNCFPLFKRGTPWEGASSSIVEVAISNEAAFDEVGLLSFMVFGLLQLRDVLCKTDDMVLPGQVAVLFSHCCTVVKRLRNVGSRREDRRSGQRIVRRHSTKFRTSYGSGEPSDSRKLHRMRQTFAAWMACWNTAPEADVASCS